MEKLKNGETVRIKGTNSMRTLIVREVDPPGHTPCAPSTYIVRLGPMPNGVPDFYLYGDHMLERAP